MKPSFTAKQLLGLVVLLICASGIAGPNEDLISACMQGDLAKVTAAIDKGADVNFEDANGNTPICNASFWPAITQLLLDKGADPNGGNYPAIVSAGNNYSVEVMKILLDAGADPNKAGKADPGVALRKMLADEKAKGKKANKTLVTAWENALKSMQPTSIYAIQLVVQQTNCGPCLEMLLDKGAKTNVIADGNLLHTIAAFGMTQEERKSVFAKGKAAMEGYGLKVPEWYADLPIDRNSSSARMVELLAAKGMDVNKLNSNNLNPLLTALGTKKVEVAKALVKAGADVKYVRKENDKNAVDFAAEIGDLDLLKAIVEKGGDITNETWDLDEETGTYCKGFTALTRAAIYDNVECAKYLIESGANIKEGVSGYFKKEARVGLSRNGPLLTNLGGKQLYCRYKLKNKMAIYFAIENNNMEMVKLLATSFGWYQNHSMEMKAQVGALADGSALKGACLLASGDFTPSRYARTLGHKEILNYLESKGK